MFGYSERFNDFAYERVDDTDFICFTDDPELKSSFWTMRMVAPEMLDPPRLAKKVKALPHVFLPDRKSTRLNSSHLARSRMPSSA